MPKLRAWQADRISTSINIRSCLPLCGMKLRPDIPPRAIFFEAFFADSSLHYSCLQSVPLIYPVVTMLFILWFSFILTNIY